MYYVYILRPTKFPDPYYTGSTSNLEARLQKHNIGDYNGRPRCFRDNVIFILDGGVLPRLIYFPNGYVRGRSM
jgi:hypothetical protein